MNDPEAPFQQGQSTVKGMVENAERLGLTWGTRPATVVSYDLGTGYAQAVFDGDTTQIDMISLIGPVLQDFRVMVMQVPPGGNYIISALGVPPPGLLVFRAHQEVTQTLTTAVNAFVTLDTLDTNFFGTGWSASASTKFLPPIPGWYNCVGRVVFAANATSRRGAFINTNASTSGFGTLGGQSVQTPATGTAQVQAIGEGYFNGTSDFVGLRALQNSGGNLDTNTSDGGSTLSVYYVGAYAPTTVG